MQAKKINIDELTLVAIEPTQSSEKDRGNVGRQCPKCGHVRLSSESNTPAYECPKCGVVYDKVEQLLSATGRMGS